MSLKKAITISEENFSDNESDSGSESDSDNNTESNIRVQLTNKNIGAIYYEYLKDDTLLLRPDYQRDICWSLEKMNAFIDTIIKGLIVPNYVIYILSSKEQNNYDHCYECIDGQHRLTTLKWFIEGIKYLDTNKYIYYKSNKRERVFYNMSVEQLKEISTRRRVKCRNLTKDEKVKFDNFNMSFHIIQSSRDGMSMETKCDIFNRLQNGEKVNSYEKLKNLHTNQIISCIAINKLCKYLKEINFINKFYSFNGTSKKPDAFNMYFLIRSFLIIDKQNLNVNFLDLNIKRYIESNNGLGAPNVRLNNDVNELLPKVIEIINFINYHEELTTQILPELAYIFICIYANYGLEDVDKVIKWFINPSNLKQFNKLNNIKSYKDDHNKVTSSNKITMNYNNILKIILKKELSSEKVIDL
jgi:hypothetical protein